MFTKEKSELIELKAEAEALGLTFNYFINEIIDYNDAGVIALDSVEVYYTFSFSEMIGEYKRKISKAQKVAALDSAKDFMLNNL
jgi:hypothetical protein